jgi:hypothetical protein
VLLREGGLVGFSGHEASRSRGRRGGGPPERAKARQGSPRLAWLSFREQSPWLFRITEYEDKIGMTLQAPAVRALPIWQSALLRHGCQVNSAGHLLPVELHPHGDRIVCTPAMSGSMLPFHVNVTVGRPVIITWDSGLSRYIVRTAGSCRAA